MKRLSVLFLSIILCLFVFYGCSSEDNLPSKARVFYDALPNDISTLDPANIRDIYSYQIARQIFEGLVKIGQNREVIPLLAKQWEIDGNTISFYLRKDAFFKDASIPGGEKILTAEDVLASIKHSLQPGGLGGWLFGETIEGVSEYVSGKTQGIIGISVIDPHTIKIKCTSSPKLLLLQLTTPAGYIMPSEAIEHYGNKLRKHPVGTGPFSLSEWTPDRQIVLKKNPKYWGSTKGNIDEVVVSIIKDDLIRFLEFQKKDLDVVSIPSFKMEEVIADNGSLLKKYSNFKLSKVDTNQTQFIGFVNKNPLFKNKKLKQALNLAVDRQMIAKKVLHGKAVENGSYLPYIFQKGIEKRNFPPYSFDLEKAKSLLSEAGYPKGQGLDVLNLLVATGTPWEALGESVQDMLKKIGVRLNLEVVPFPLLFGKISKGEADMFLFGISAAYPSPHALLSLLHSRNIPPKGFNFFFYTNPVVDNFIDELSKTYDLTMVSDIEEALHKDPPMIFLYSTLEVMLIKGEIENLHMDEIPSYRYASIIKK